MVFYQNLDFKKLGGFWEIFDSASFVQKLFLLSTAPKIKNYFTLWEAQEQRMWLRPLGLQVWIWSKQAKSNETGNVTARKWNKGQGSAMPSVQAWILLKYRRLHLKILGRDYSMWSRKANNIMLPEFSVRIIINEKNKHCTVFYVLKTKINWMKYEKWNIHCSSSQLSWGLQWTLNKVLGLDCTLGNFVTACVTY